jgi:histidinol-phosphate/aromatic aminotransferase/cobyric acid decarboxylase-like protein
MVDARDRTTHVGRSHIYEAKRMPEQLIYLDRNENNYGPAPACFDVLKQAGAPTLSTYSREFSRGVKRRFSSGRALRTF